MPPRSFGFPYTSLYTRFTHPFVITVRRPWREPSFGAKETARLRSIEHGRRVMRERQSVLLARADSARRLRHVRNVGDIGVRSVSQGINWVSKLKTLQKSDTYFKVPYKGPRMFGPRPKHKTIIGRKIWEYVQKQKRIQYQLTGRLRRLGGCYPVSIKRMQAGWKADLLTGRTPEQQRIFDCIAGSRYGTYPKLWRNKVPKNLRFRGVPGALAYLGKADVVGTNAVWRGELEPGAPLQIWWTKTPGESGHSAVLHRYIRNNKGHKGQVVGLVFTDQWSDYKVLRKLKKKETWPHIYGAKFKKRRP